MKHSDDISKANRFEEQDERSREQIEGKNAVLELLRSERPVNKLFVAKGEKDPVTNRILDLARSRGIVFQQVDRIKLDQMSTSRSHQGIIAMTSPVEYVEPDEILKIADEREESPFIIILDGITDHNNLGSILRTAECTGVHGVILPKRRSASVNSTVAKVSAGAVEYIPVARVTNISRTIEWLKKEGVWVVGTDTEGGNTFFETDLKGPVALVIGSEGEGISRLVKEKCDYLVSIPMKGRISSLNAGVAAAIVMYEISKQRSTSHAD